MRAAMKYLSTYLVNTAPDQQSSAVIAFLASIDHLSSTHPLIADSIIQELKDQRSYLKMIASENFSSLSVQLAMGNLLTDKYAEGYPFHRFYAGCDNVDAIEIRPSLALNRFLDAIMLTYSHIQALMPILLPSGRSSQSVFNQKKSKSSVKNLSMNSQPKSMSTFDS